MPLIRKHVASGTIVHADESSAWDVLHAAYDMHRVNHSAEYVSEDGSNVNQAESFFSRLRRAEYGMPDPRSPQQQAAQVRPCCCLDNNRGWWHV